MKLLGETVDSVALEQPIKKKPPGSIDTSAVIDDTSWATWQSFLAYPKSPLDAQLELADESSPVWRLEKVTFSAAYNSDRVIAYLFLPKNESPPFQVVVFWPGAYAWFATSSEDGEALADREIWEYLVKDGRAVIYPILKGTFERRGSLLEDAQGVFEARDRLWASKDLTIMKVKDISRSLDYLATRSDMDMERIALFGFSSGGYQAPLPCAVDSRLKACLIVSGGAPYPEVLGFARRVTIPVQMVNGRYDSLLPYEESQRPLFRALGTREELKRHVVFDTDHMLSGFDKEMVRVNLEWLDRFLGPVR
jgi:dienelactone hydrolase